MATRSRSSSGSLRRPSISIGFTPGGRTALLDSLVPNKAEAENKAYEDIKNQAQDVLDGNRSVKDFMATVDKYKSQLPDKQGTFATYANSTLKALDTQKFNEYMNGGTLKDFQAYVDGRKGDTGGNADFLASLWGKAQQNEDVLKYNSYVKGDLPYNDYIKYAADRIQSGGSADKIGAQVAQATTHENQLQDNNRSAAYTAGLLSASDYTNYLNQRLTSEPNATVQTQIRVAAKQVETNEMSKQVNGVINDWQTGKASAGDAISRLSGLLGQTNDPQLQNAISSHINQIRSSGAAGANAARTSAISQQNQARDLASAAKSDHKDQIDALNKQLSGAKPSDVTSIINQMDFADDVYARALGLSEKMSPFGEWQTFFNNETQSAFAVQDERRMNAYRTVASNLANDAKNASKGDPYAGYSAAAQFLYDAANDPKLHPQYQEALQSLGNGYVTAARNDHASSGNGYAWDNEVGSILTDMATGVSDHPKMDNALIAAGAPTNNKGIVDFNDTRTRTWLEQQLAGPNAGAIYDMIKAAGGYRNIGHPVVGEDGKPVVGSTGQPTMQVEPGGTKDVWLKELKDSGAAEIRGVLDAQMTGTKNSLAPYTREIARQQQTPEYAAQAATTREKKMDWNEPLQATEQPGTGPVGGKDNRQGSLGTGGEPINNQVAGFPTSTTTADPFNDPSSAFNRQQARPINPPAMAQNTTDQGLPGAAKAAGRQGSLGTGMPAQPAAEPQPMTAPIEDPQALGVSPYSLPPVAIIPPDPISVRPVEPYDIPPVDLSDPTSTSVPEDPVVTGGMGGQGGTRQV